MTEDQACMTKISTMTAISDKVIQCNEVLVEIWDKDQLPYISNVRAKALLSISKLYDEFNKDKKRRGNNAEVNVYGKMACNLACESPKFRKKS